MVVGIGTDILKINDLNADNLKENDPFLLATYTTLEIRAAQDRENSFYYYATRFAGKEAVFKALNRTSNKVGFCDIEILNMESGQPYVTLHGTLLKEAREVGIQKVLISLSYDCDYAIAYATAIGRIMEVGMCKKGGSNGCRSDSKIRRRSKTESSKNCISGEQ